MILTFPFPFLFGHLFSLRCKFCKHRKIKCNFEVPCSNCIKYNVSCEAVSKDLRKNKFSNSYVSTLKDKIKTLEEFILALKHSDHMKRDELLADFPLSDSQNLDLEDNASNIPFKDPTKDTIQQFEQRNIVVDKFETGQISVYGNPSIFIPIATENTSKQASKPDFQYFHCPVILKYISIFFKWQYMEYNLYIYRESFLTDFFKDKGDLKDSLPYCNEELIFAICACGSTMDFDDDVFLYKGILYDTSEKFYNRARYLVFQKLNTDDCNNIPTIQAFLCLAFYDLGRGRTLSAWVLLGIAIRIGLHMGFELNFHKNNDSDIDNDTDTSNSSDSSNDRFSNKSNNNNNSNNSSKTDKDLNLPKLPLTDYDINVKSRIYWGFRIADYYISFVLGRSPTLEHLPANIPDSENLPILPGVEFFIYYDPVLNESKIYNISRPLKKINILFKLVNEYRQIIFKETPKLNIESTGFQILHNLNNFNLKMFEWKDSLGDELYWTKVELRTEGYNPNIMALRYQYYLVLLSFNRYFIDGAIDLKGSIAPIEICSSAIEDVYNSIFCFKTHHHIRYISLNMVYLTILSITILQKMPDNITFPVKKSTMVDFFGYVLKESSKTWGLSKVAYKAFNHYFTNSENVESKPSSPKQKFRFSKQDENGDESDIDESMIPSLNYS